MATELDADALITRLALQPHPEGGRYRQSFRDQALGARRAASTAILYLLKAGEQSAWHRVDAVEIWHWYAGAPLLLSLSDGGAVERILLGSCIEAGETPQAMVANGRWQAARSLGAFSLVGCTVAPGFEFSGFELAAAGFPQP